MGQHRNDAFSILNAKAEEGSVYSLVRDALPEVRYEKPAGSGPRSLHIGIDLQTLAYRETGQRGIGQYTRNHLRALMQLAPHHRYTLFSRHNSNTLILEDLALGDNVHFAPIGSEAHSKLDLYHITDSMSLLPDFSPPIGLAPQGIPTTVLFYDLIPLCLRQAYYDRWSAPLQRAYGERMTMLRRPGLHFLSISDCTKRDLSVIGGIDPSAISVIMGGVRQVTEAPLSPADAQAVLNRYGLKSPFFLSVGGLDPHKDCLTPAQAFVELRRKHAVQYVVVGSEIDPFKTALQEHYAGLGVNDVIFPGYIPREDLMVLYRNCLALVFPSFYEGFGLPVLEAMAAGAPVITTSAGSLPEVAGNAALLVEPGNKDQLQRAMEQVVSDASLRESLRSRGSERAKQFTWDETARRTLEIWEKMVPRHVGRES